MENAEEKIIENSSENVIENTKMSPKEKRNVAIILSVLAIVVLGTIITPIIGSLSSVISPSKKAMPSFSWDTQTPGLYKKDKTFRTNENVFSLNKNGDGTYVDSVSLTEDDVYLVMPSSFTNDNNEKTNLTSLPNKEGNIFSGTNKLEGIYFPSLYTSIGNYSFSSMPSLKEVKFGSGDGVQVLGDYVFKDSSSLTSVTFSRNLTTLGKGAFEGASSITSIDFSNTSIKTIGEECFSGCSSLSSVYLTTSITSLPKNLFKSCSALTSITYEGTVNAWNNLSKDSSWNASSSIAKIVCSDGIIQE